MARRLHERAWKDIGKSIEEDKKQKYYEQYLLWSAGKVKTETALNFTGYPNVEVFLQDLNNEESQTENESVVEDEEDEELE